MTDDIERRLIRPAQRAMTPKTKQFAMVPRNSEDMFKLATMIANSDLAPKDYKGKPENCLIAMQMGAEVGLAPMQSIQNIAIINGRPCVWGDAALALCKQDRNSDIFECTAGEVRRLVAHWEKGSYRPSTPLVEFVLTKFDPSWADNTAICAATDGRSPRMHIFTQEMAKKAQLWGKTGPWTNYPERMMQMRARGFCLRDVFPDRLKGLAMNEEVEDYEIGGGVSVLVPRTAPQPLASGKFGFTHAAKAQQAPQVVEQIAEAVEVPAANEDPAIAEHRKVVLGAVDWWAKKGVEAYQLCAVLGHDDVSEFTADDVKRLRDIAGDIKLGSTTLEAVFPPAPGAA